MKKSTSDLIKKYENIGPYALIDTNLFTFFGNEFNDDLVVSGKCKNANLEFLVDGVSAKINKTDLLSLSKSIDSLSKTSAFASFQLTSNAIGLIKETVRKIDATHLRIHNISNLVRISIFDYRKFLPKSLIQRAITQKIRYYETKNANIASDFSCTLFADSFLKLSNQDMNIRVGKNGICQFEPIKDSVKFLFRDQEIIEPVATTFSDRLGCQISLSLVPKS